MKVTEIDKPILTPIKIYVDIESFMLPSALKPGKKFVEPYVKLALDKLSFDFELHGLINKKEILGLPATDDYDFVNVLLGLPYEHWGNLLREEGTILLFYGAPSNVEIFQYVPTNMRFRFISDIDMLKYAFTQRGNTTPYINTVSPYKRGKDNKFIKFIKDLF